MTFNRAGGLTAAVLAMLVLGGPAGAQEAPALKGLEGQARAAMEQKIALAKAEGIVDYLEIVYAPATVDALAKEFRQHYGLGDGFRVVYTQAGTAAAVTRLEQELSSGSVRTDVASLPVPPWVYAQAASGNIMEYHSPEHAAYGKAFAMKAGKPGFFAPNGLYFFVPMWDPSRLDFKGTSWKDVIGSVPNGRITIPNGETSLSTQATILGVKNVIGIDFFKEIAKMKPVLLSRGEMAHDRVVVGQDLISLYGQATHTRFRNRRGANIKLLIPDEGAVLIPQLSFILAKAPHPNAAKLWVDFMLSDAGQAIIIDRETMVSGRDGAKSPMEEYDLTIDGIKSIPMEWDKITADDLKAIGAEWASIFIQ